MSGAAHAHVHVNEPRPQTRPAHNRAPVIIINSVTNEINNGNVITFGIRSFLFLLFSPASFLLINFLRSFPRFGGKCVPILAVGPLEARTAFVFKEDEGLGSSRRRCKRQTFRQPHLWDIILQDVSTVTSGAHHPCEVIFCHRGGFLASSLLSLGSLQTLTPPPNSVLYC